MIKIYFNVNSDKKSVINYLQEEASKENKKEIKTL